MFHKIKMQKCHLNDIFIFIISCLIFRRERICIENCSNKNEDSRVLRKKFSCSFPHNIIVWKSQIGKLIFLLFFHHTSSSLKVESKKMYGRQNFLIHFMTNWSLLVISHPRAGERMGVCVWVREHYNQCN
jgi:hypothetical protein